jgi:hypothetical protein
VTSKAENSFIRGVHVYVQSYNEKMHNAYRGGTPDVWYSGNKGRRKYSGDLWAEYKFIVVPKKDTTMIVPELSKLQFEWLRDRRAEGRDVTVIVGCREGAVIFDREVDWKQGMTTERFRASLMSRKDTAAYIDDRVATTAHGP